MCICYWCSTVTKLWYDTMDPVVAAEVAPTWTRALEFESNKHSPDVCLEAVRGYATVGAMSEAMVLVEALWASHASHPATTHALLVGVGVCHRTGALSKAIEYLLYVPLAQ